MTVTTPMEGITAPARPAAFPAGTLVDEAALLSSRRQDGWSAANQRLFLEAIAEGHGVDSACARVGLSASSAYAFRRTAKGATFALGWRAACLVARDCVAETLMVRALEGQVDTVVRPDSTVITRHRHDNRLAMGLLARLDRQVEAAPDADVKAARLVAQEFDAYLDLVARDEGPARAGLFLARRCGTLDAGEGEAAPDLAPILALAAADRFARTGAATAQEVDVADLDAAARTGWTAEQWARAEAAGLVAIACPAPPPAQPAPAPQDSQHSPQVDADDCVWWDEDDAEWRTCFPPPAGFLGYETGEFGEVDYYRTLTEEEAALAGPDPDHLDAAEAAALTAARDAWIAARTERPLAADEPDAPPCAAQASPSAVRDDASIAVRARLPLAADAREAPSSAAQGLPSAVPADAWAAAPSPRPQAADETGAPPSAAQGSPSLDPDTADELSPSGTIVAAAPTPAVRDPLDAGDAPAAPGGGTQAPPCPLTRA